MTKKGKECSGFVKVNYHNKGIEMIGLHQILRSRYVKCAVPQFLRNREPPMVSYSYTRTIHGKIFNQKSVVEELDVNSASLRKKHINKKRKHVIKSKKHLESLNAYHNKYVLVPADMAAHNVIVVCKKYYLEVVTKEITATTTYDPVARDKADIISDHLRYII